MGILRFSHIRSLINQDFPVPRLPINRTTESSGIILILNLDNRRLRVGRDASPLGIVDIIEERDDPAGFIYITFTFDFRPIYHTNLYAESDENKTRYVRLEMSGFRGRGRGRGRGQAQGRGPTNAKPKFEHIAKPAVSKLPTNLQFFPSSDSIPPVILDSFPEFKHSQTFFSGLELLMPELENSHKGYLHCWCGISGEQIQGIQRESDTSFVAKLAFTDNTSTPIFVKRIHLLEPVSAMKGDYLLPEDGALPYPSELLKNTLHKLNEPMNEAYVDSIFALYASKLVEGGYSPGWCKCYGTYVARTEKYLYNMTDEYMSMRNESWWRTNQRLGLFSIYNGDIVQEKGQETDAKQPSSDFFEDLTDLVADDFVELGDTQEPVSEEEESAELTEPELAEEEQDEQIPVKLSTPKLRLKRLKTNSSDHSQEEDICQRFAEFRNFPVQITFLELAEGTVDSLIDIEDDDDPSMTETKEKRWAAWLFQIVAALAVAQHWFGFVHNDLHTNNVMWCTTDLPFLYYCVRRGGQISYRKVPTYGRIMKIIDFGRSSFTLPTGFVISDAFFPGNDASDQYNCQPFFDPKKGKKIEPNPSFDLCRLAVSLIESLFTERPADKQPLTIMTREDGGKKLYTETVSGVYNLLWSWLQDDAGKNVLRSPNGEERYPDFDLYRAIASDVHRAVPKHQIDKPIFQEYKCTDIPTNTTVYDIFV